MRVEPFVVNFFLIFQLFSLKYHHEIHLMYDSTFKTNVKIESQEKKEEKENGKR